MKNNTTKYTYTKSIRFTLEQENGDALHPNVQEFRLHDLIEQCKEFSCNVKDFIYHEQNKDGEHTIDTLISVKKSWLKNHFKNDFYNKKRQDLFIKNIDYAKQGLENWCKNWEQYTQDMEDWAKTANYEKARHADIATTVLALSSKKMFPFIHDFIHCANHKNHQKKLDTLKKDSKKLSVLLENVRLHFLPKQNAGLMMAQASTNYYTVNKKPKEYEQALKEAQEKLENNENDTYRYDPNKGVLYIEDKIFPLGIEEKAWFNEHSNNTPYSLDDIYGIIKQFKAKMKSLFYEQVRKDYTKETLRKNFCLFNDMECLEGFITIDKALAKDEKEYNRKKNDTLKKRIKDKKNKRGAYLINTNKNEKQKNMYFKGWVSLCDAYKTIAQERGKLIAQIKGIKKEKFESSNTTYWALFYSKDQDKYLWLVPRDTIQAAKKDIDGLSPPPNNQQSLDGILYITHSLTMRALHKLCFAEQSTFVKEMPKWLICKQKKVIQATDDTKKLEKIRRNDTHKQSKTELMLPFLKAVIESEYAKKLDLTHFYRENELEKLHEAKTLQDFEQSLEHACYYMEQKIMGNTQNFIKEHNVKTFKITSYDLEGRNENTHQTPPSEQRRHTKEIWNKFWSGDKSIRLNPEIKIRFREKDTKVHKYLAEKNFDTKSINNRFLQDKLIVSFTFALNAGKLHPQLAFTKTEDILKEINAFNKEFNKQHWECSYKYGIDRGNKELSTLCIAKFNKGNTYQHDGKEFLSPSFPNGDDDIQCYELEKKWYREKAISNLENPPKTREKSVIANLSYFIDKVDDKDWFTKKPCTCIDLTIAKLIKDKIVLNGDILTFLKLKKEAAKRKIFDLVSKGEIKTENDFKCNPKESIPSLGYQPKADGKKFIDIYFYEDRFEGLIYGNNYKYTKDNIKDTFKKYIEHLLKNKANPKNQDEHTPSMIKINHLRDALVANMIGVIFHLQERYPGIVILEDLEKSDIDKHFDSLNISISRRLEWAMYKKFQTLGKVPPHVKDIIDIREQVRNEQKKEKEIQEEIPPSQIGAMVFVDKANTSQNCPYCNKKSPQKREDKFINNRYICKSQSCGFDTNLFKETNNIDDKFKFLQEIDDPDKVAAYNIAKKIQDYKNIKELRINT